MNNQSNVYDCNDENLGQMLQRLFSEGHDEVVIRNPMEGTDGEDIVVTRADFDKHLRNLAKVANMSPADKLEANKRLKNIKNAKQIKFRTAMITAKVHTVDIEDDENFGRDIDGETLDIDGMIFVPICDYPKGLDQHDNEIGTFVDESEKRQPIRIAGIISDSEG